MTLPESTGDDGTGIIEIINVWHVTLSLWRFVFTKGLLNERPVLMICWVLINDSKDL
jgi:hypothetical protein